MASETSPSVEQIVKAINEDGFYFQEDVAKGIAGDEFARKRFPIVSVEGMEFCKAHTVDDPRVTGFLESTYDWTALGVYTYLFPFPDCVHGFISRMPRNQGLIVQIWGRGSQATFIKGSQNLLLDIPSKNHNEMLEFPRNQLASCEKVTVDLKEGGVTMLDVRLGFTITKGFAITFIFGTRERVDTWAKMELPFSTEAGKLIEEIKGVSSKIGANFQFK